MVLLIVICFQDWLKQSIVCYSMSITRSDHCILNTCMLVVLWYDLLAMIIRMIIDDSFNSNDYCLYWYQAILWLLSIQW